MTKERDRTPMDQRWVQNYVEQLQNAAAKFPPGAMQDALLRRVEAVMDLVEAWQKRGWEEHRCTECGARYEEAKEYCTNTVSRNGRLEPCGGKVRMV